MNYTDMYPYLIWGILLIVLIWRVKRGYQRGLVNEIASLIAIVAGIFSLYLLYVLYCAYQSKTYKTMLIAVVVLIGFGLAYKIGRLILTPIKGIVGLPLIGFLDKLLGAITGGIETILIAHGIQYILFFFEQPVMFAVPKVF